MKMITNQGVITPKFSAKVAILALTLCLLANHSAVATIVVTNHSFEADENTDGIGRFGQANIGSFPGNELTGWISQGSTADNQVSVGWASITAAELDPSPAVGGQESQALSLQSGASVLNTTATSWASLTTGDVLTLTISLGGRNGQSNQSWNEATFFGLTDGAADLSTVEIGDTVANSGLITGNPGNEAIPNGQIGEGLFADVSFDYTVLASDMSRSGNIGILIYSEGTGGSSTANNQSFFDNVRLNLAPVPEPGTATLFALGLSVLFASRRRRK